MCAVSISSGMTLRFEGLGVLITGAAGGIGAEAARRFAQEGAAVAATDLSLRAVAAVAAEIRTGGGRIVPYELDVTDPGSVRRALSLANADFGHLDCLVNSAGVREITPIVDLSFEEWSRVIAVNLTGTFLASQAFARVAIEQQRGGSIVNLSSTAGLLGLPNRAAYVSAKHAVIGLTKQMAVELGPHRIRVNAVAPGVVRTAMTEQYFHDPATIKMLEDSHPIGRWAEPGEIAEAILFLSSAASGFTTGATLAVDGGFTAGRRF